MRNGENLNRIAKCSGALVAAVALLAAPAWAHRIEKRFSVDVRPVVTVRNFHGRISVKSWQKQEVLVVADHVSEKTEVDADQMGNRIDIVTHHLSEKISPQELEANYEITVPEETELQLRTDSGTVIVERVTGDMTIDTVAARVDLKEVSGYLVINTVGGSMVCFRCAGRIDFKSISGNLDLTQPVSQNIRANTTSGRILFDGDFLRGGVYIFKTFNGPIEVRISESDSFQLNATSNGPVDSLLKFKPPSHNRRAPTSQFANTLSGTYNDGLARVELTSVSGTIKIAKRD